MGIYIEFSCGRRGVSETTCRWCDALIHENGADDHPDSLVGSAWLDGALRSKCDLPLDDPRSLHHEPALEMGPRLGPFEQDYLQITYSTLRHEAEIVAYLHVDGDWMIADPWTGAGERYSDINIFLEA